MLSNIFWSILVHSESKGKQDGTQNNSAEKEWFISKREINKYSASKNINYSNKWLTIIVFPKTLHIWFTCLSIFMCSTIGQSVQILSVFIFFNNSTHHFNNSNFLTSHTIFKAFIWYVIFLYVSHLAALNKLINYWIMFGGYANKPIPLFKWQDAFFAILV